MRKYPKIVQALMNLEKQSIKNNIARNKMQDHAEWLELIYFDKHEFNTYEFAWQGRIDFFVTEIQFVQIPTKHTSPFVYLNLN